MTLEDLLAEAARLGVVSLWYDPFTDRVHGRALGVFPAQLVCTIGFTNDSCDNCGGSGGGLPPCQCTVCGGSGRNT